MRKFTIFSLITLVVAACTSETSTHDAPPAHDLPHELFVYTDNLEPRWSSFENITAEKGAGGKENYGAKGHPFERLVSGERKVLLDVEGPGIVNRMWITISQRSPEVLRGLVLNMYWDNANTPAVSVPFGDFFSIGLGKTLAFENALFANPEGRSFNAFVQMPFKNSARIEVVNELDSDVDMLFFDVNYQKLRQWNPDFLYFHAYWHRDTATVPGVDFELLPRIEGRGRFLGTNVSLTADPVYRDYWWGEGEVKMYMDGDSTYPTLVGTGTEDYIGTAWGQGEFIHRYTGCPIADVENLRWTYYRFHIPDPVYFGEELRVTLQQMGGSAKGNVLEMLEEGADLIPVTINGPHSSLIHIYYPDSTVDLTHASLPGENAWTNFYRSDDVAAVSYFYLDKPENDLPKLQPLPVRTWNLE